MRTLREKVTYSLRANAKENLELLSMLDELETAVPGFSDREFPSISVYGSYINIDDGGNPHTVAGVASALMQHSEDYRADAYRQGEPLRKEKVNGGLKTTITFRKWTAEKPGIEISIVNRSLDCEQYRVTRESTITVCGQPPSGPGIIKVEKIENEPAARYT